MSVVHQCVLVFGVLSGLVSAAPASETDRLILPPTPTEAPEVASTACGDLIVSKEQGQTLFWASDVFDCLSNVPFIPDVASRFISYYNQTLQFQSTLAFLKDPPQGYQQPPVDVVAELGLLQDNISEGKYTTQYAFEADLQLLINRFHDSHVYLSAGLLAPFTFISPFSLVSASRDGKVTPSVYFRDEVVNSQLQGGEPSPITKINDIDVVEYLTSFAEINSEGYLEPHADWNALFESPALDIQSYQSVLHSALFYPGDAINYTQANGTTTYSYWLASYSEAGHTGPLTTAGDFYNYFVLGILPESWDASNPQWWPDWKGETDDSDDSGTDAAPSLVERLCTSGNPKNVNWCGESQGGFPNDPDYVQKDLGRLTGGVVSGYFLDDTTGVLSIPSFLQTGNDTLNFFRVIDDFLGDAQDKGISRVIIDLQQNYGGLNLLAVSVFKRFFYEQEPWTGSRIRTSEMANTLGESYSSWWDSLETGHDGALDPNYQYFSSSEWVIDNRINPATGANYSSWDEYRGPVSYQGDTFSNLQLYNLSDQVFDIAGFQGWIPFGYSDTPPDPPPPSWSPDSIVLLTDGLCTSACATFVELMAHQAGVKTLVVGGRPATGPMQAASGSRGARLYSSEALDYDFSNVNDTVEDFDAFARLPQRGNNDLFINFAGFNIRDQIRKGDEDNIPVQFKYDAADCRLYYSLQNIYNLTQLWTDVATAAWDDPSLCVEDSTGYSVRNNSTQLKSPPKRTAQAPDLNLDHITFSDLASNSTSSPSLYDFITRDSISTTNLKQCFHQKGDCAGTTLQCRDFGVDCDGQGTTWRTMSACLPDTTNYGSACGDGMWFKETRDAESKKNVPKKTINGVQVKYEPVTVVEGYCVPESVDIYKFNLGCPNARR
ncbi:uncharacterized protein N0V89_007217 [Didymosphaeria variabile]|uniref:CPAF-like PDZ domain-containing protein n=1 Tax=Didymosphaeria variabile TaxID=1932322 RepID=A0A9W8XKM9_9PLEO|nr:uncharacterized protein N0V89_007217 [Didymosphaeria variabile]KAJ4351873.1 hypothetical protein N0V89_007217 [Didymosphaeria variabile]